MPSTKNSTKKIDSSTQQEILSALDAAMKTNDLYVERIVALNKALDKSKRDLDLVSLEAIRVTEKLAEELKKQDQQIAYYKNKLCDFIEFYDEMELDYPQECKSIAKRMNLFEEDGVDKFQH